MKNSPRRDTDLSARFTAAEKRRVELALVKTGKNMTDFVRDAVLDRADQALEADSVASFAGAIGALHVEGDFGRRVDAVYAQMLVEKHERRQRASRFSQAARSSMIDDPANENASES